ncbi:MAG: T9SS type A sorting domain-containing protein [Candidatus Cloacimonetes bacterium]|nr:T9SS type A sorting domain-containing protein [Candidatus Cloacimonadota bacterium]
MKKIYLFFLLIFWSLTLYANSSFLKDHFSSEQNSSFTAEDVVDYLNDSKAEGDLTFGSEYVFHSDATMFICAALLDDNHFVVVYNNGNDYGGEAVIGTVSGNVISFGSNYVFDEDYIYFPSVAALDATHFVVAYRQRGGVYPGVSVLGTVSGSTISFSSSYTFNSSSTTHTSTAKLDATHFVIVYRDDGDNSNGRAIIGTVSGTTISYGSPSTFNSGRTDDKSVAKLDDTHIVVTYKDHGNYERGTATIGTISGNSITFGSEYVFNIGSTSKPSVAALTSTSFVVAYYDGSGNSIVGTVSGSTISYGSEYTFHSEPSGGTDYPTTARLGPTHFIVACKGLPGYTTGYARVGFVDGTTISYGEQGDFNSGQTEDLYVIAQDAKHAIFTYTDVGNSSYGTARVGTIETTLPIVLSTFTAQFINNTPTIHWSTQTETDNMGWFIYRSEENNFSSAEVISEMIEGQGTTTLQSNYVFEDSMLDPEIGDTYYYWLESIDYSGMVHHYNNVAVLTIPDEGNSGHSGIAEPEYFGLLQNEPNPVISSTRISFNLPETGLIDLAIYNLKGQLVKTLYSGNTSKHTVMWDGKDEQGKEIESGVYFYKMVMNGKTVDTKKLILLR